ncbi:hypothetical protein E4U09_003162 [Claviceps aff. purpurea]|uniref:Uncharacterized protein n=1 Tax=Claviceps aff. purpurea TaxID=1967640 RepID=A0A9P7U5D0_9HYPO|nr:hypothetical protein E4U09_003162 [Claviceps aff. purpurea]
MRLLTALTFASGALALATGLVHDPADQQTVQGDVLLNPENAVLATPEITPRDETVSSSEVGKRNPGTEATVRMPNGPSPASVTIAGITVSFMMAHRWIQVNGKNVLEYYVRNVTFRNGTRGRVFVDAVANGLNFFTMRMAAGVQYSDDPPFGADTFKLVVRPINDEL